MELKIHGSSSAGNCYVLENDNEALLIEAGLPYKIISELIDFNYSKFVGCLISHRHGDHAVATPKIQNVVDVFANKDTINKWGLDKANEIESGKAFRVGGFTILPFNAVHDVPCMGFFISHDDMGKLVFITDSAYINYNFAGVNHLMIECNYTAKELYKSVNNGVTPSFQSERIKGTHMELMETIDVVRDNTSDELNNVILLHLSERNSAEAEILDTFRSVLGIEPIIAVPNLNIKLTKNIF